MGYSAKAVANYFLETHKKENISPLKLQKLVYIAHGWHFAFRDDPLIDDEYAEAWEYGPVFPSLYHEFKHYGRIPISEFATTTYFDPKGNLVETIPKIKYGDDEERNKWTCRFLDKIWEIYGGHDGMTLSGMCHQKESPWDMARKSDTRRNVHIKDDDIREYYKTKRKENLENE